MRGILHPLCTWQLHLAVPTGAEFEEQTHLTLCRRIPSVALTN